MNRRVRNRTHGGVGGRRGDPASYPIAKEREGYVSRSSKAKRDSKVRKKKTTSRQIRKVPFFGNPDNTHCFQACVRMLLKYFMPNLDYSWAELDKLTGKKEGLWTSPLYGMIQLKQMGFEMIDIGVFDYERFSQEGESYVKERYGEKVGTEQIEHCDIPTEMKNVELFLECIELEQRLPDLKDIIDLLKAGYLVICNVNSCMLNDLPNYIGHFVLIYHIGSDYILMHDPGLPPNESRKVTHDKFLASWAYPSESEKNVMAFRFGNKHLHKT
jgi:hypothetical protein